MSCRRLEVNLHEYCESKLPASKNLYASVCRRRWTLGSLLWKPFWKPFWRALWRAL